MTVTLPPPRCSHLSARADPGTTPRQSAEACRSSKARRGTGGRAGRNSFNRVRVSILRQYKLRTRTSTRKTSGRPKQRNYPGNRTEPVARASLRVVTANTIGASDSSSHPDPLSTSPPPSQARYSKTNGRNAHELESRPRRYLRSASHERKEPLRLRTHPRRSETTETV